MVEPLDYGALLAQIADLKTGIQTRTVIGQAEGILIERHKVSPEVAFAMLRRTSNTTNQKLRDVAADLVRTGQEHPDPARPPSA